MPDYLYVVKAKLTALINEMSEAPALFVKNPKTDFTRNRKLPFGMVMELLISMGGNSIYKELLDAQGYDVNTATTSAFIQQREKLLPFAFEFLLSEFTSSCPVVKKYRGYRLFAADGSDAHIPTNPDDPETFFQAEPDAKGYNLLHINALYDLCNRLYADTCVQPGRHENEHKALVTMVDRSPVQGKVIVIADRLYESYNDFAHIERKGWNYLIRMKDRDSNGILSGLSLPSDDEFDVCCQRILTRKQTKDVKNHPEIYRFVPHHSTFDFLDLDTNKFYPISFRLVRFKITDHSYETVITNLDSASFSPHELKTLYHTNLD